MVNDHVPPLPCSTLMALPSASVTSMDVTFLPASGFTVSVTFSPGATLLVSTVTWPPSTCSMETTSPSAASPTRMVRPLTLTGYWG